MLHPEDIEGREFFVGLRGYDREEVDGFLAELAAEHRALLEEVEALRNREPEQVEVAVARDPFEDLGASVTAILRTANDSAATIREDAEQYAERARREVDEEIARLRHEADDYAERTKGGADEAVAAIRAEAEAHAQRVKEEADEAVADLRSQATAYAEQVRREAEADAVAERGRAEADVVRARTQAEELRGEAQKTLEEATAHADRLVAEARAESERALTEARTEAESIIAAARTEQDRLVAEAEAHIAELEVEAERRGLERAAATADEAVARLSEATRRHEDLRHRLAEANDEIQLALLALGEPIVDANQAISAAVRGVIDLETVSGEAEVVNAEH